MVGSPTPSPTPRAILSLWLSPPESEEGVLLAVVAPSVPVPVVFSPVPLDNDDPPVPPDDDEPSVPLDDDDPPVPLDDDDDDGLAGATVPASATPVATPATIEAAIVVVLVG